MDSFKRNNTALSSLAAESTLIAAKQAKSKNIKVSLDLNFRKNLWKWSKSKTSQELAKETMSKILPYIDVLIANEEDCSDVLDIKADNTDVSKGAIDATKYTQVAKKVYAPSLIQSLQLQLHSEKVILRLTIAGELCCTIIKLIEVIFLH